MFSSHIERVIEIVKVAEKHDKKVAIDGYSLKASFEIVKALGYFHPKKDVLIPVEKIDSYLLQSHRHLHRLSRRRKCVFDENRQQKA